MQKKEKKTTETSRSGKEKEKNKIGSENDLSSKLVAMQLVCALHTRIMTL